MVEKRAIVRLSAEGGETVRGEFASIGRSATAMGGDLKKVGRDAGAMTTDMQRAVDSFAGIDAEQKSAAASARTFASALGQEEARFKSLKASIDPAYAAQIRYETAIQKVQRAQRLGIATNQQAEVMLETLERQYRQTGAATEQMMAAQTRNIGGSRAFASQMQNASYQVGDFFVQVAAGTTASRALAMQLPQLLGGFGLIGAAAGAVAAILGALVPMMFKTADAAGAIDSVSLDGARSAVQNLAELEDRYALAVRTRGMSQQAVSSQAVLMMGQELEAQRALLRVEEARMRNRAAQLRQQIADDKALLDSRIADATQGLTPEVGLPDFVRSQTADAALAATQRVLEANRDVTLELQEQNAELALLELGIRRIEDANRQGASTVAATSAELEAQAAMQALVARYGEDSVQVAQARAAAERDAYIEIVASSEATNEMKVAMIASYDAANGLASVDIAGGIGRGASEAERLAGALGIAVSRAMQLAMVTPGMADEDAAMSVPVVPDASGRARNRSAVESLTRLTAPPASSGGGRGGGRASSKGGSASGRSGVSDEERAIEQERTRQGREAERIIAAMRTETEKYNDELREMAELNELGYFKDAPEAYARAVSDLTEKLKQAEFGLMMDGMRSINAEMARAIVGSGNMGDVFVSQIQRMAEAAITSGLDQLTMAIFGGGGGFMSSLLPGIGSGSSTSAIPSFAGGGSTGSGARSGGLDGQGGFLAMLHPREHVVDEARGGRTGGTMNVNINLDGANGDAHIRDVVREGVSQALSQYDRSLPTRVSGIVSDERAR